MQNISDVNSSSLGNIVHQQEKSSAVPALFYATVGGAQETQSYSSSSLRTIAREDLTGLTKKTDKIYFTKSLRHIPQEELHALLDKMGEALSLLEDWRSCRDAVDAFRSFPSSLQTGETARVIAFYFAKENSPPDNAELYRRHIIQYFQDDLPIKDKNVEVWTASAKVFYHEGDSHAPVHRALTRKDIALDNRARIVLNIAAIITRETQSKQVQLFIRHFALLSLEEQKEVSLLGQTYEQQMQISPEKRMEIFAYILGHVSPTKMIPVLRVVRWLFCGASLDSLYLGSNIEALAKYIEIEDSLQKISTLWQDIPNPIDRRVLLDALLLRPPVSSILHSLQFTEKVLEKLEEEQRQPWRRTIFVLHELSIENPALQQFLSLHGETLMNENGSKLLDPSLQAEVSWILLQEFCGGYAGIGDRLFFLAQERKMSFGLLFQEIDRLGYGVFSWPHAKEAYTLAEKMHSVEERVECIHSLLPCKRWGEESTLSQVNTIPGLVTAKEVFQACSILDLLGPALADRAVALLIRSPIVLQEDSSLIDFLDHFLLEFPESKQEFFQRVRFLLGDISIPAKDKKKRAQFLMQGSALERFGNTMLFQIIALLAEAEDKTIESVMSASSFTNLCHQRGDSVLCLLFQMPDKYRERPEKYFYSCNRTIIDENEIYHDMLTLSLFSTKEDKQKVAQLLREKAKLQDLDPCFLFSPEGGFSLQDFLAHMTAFLSEYSSTFAELSLKAYPWLQFLLEHQTVFVITQKTYPLLWEKKQACLHAIYERDIEPFIPEQERSLVIKELVLGFFNQGNDAFFLHRHLKKILPMVPKERRTKDFFLAYTKLFADIRDEETAEALWGLWSSWGAQGSVLVEKMTPLIQASQDAKERFSLVSKVLQETTGSQPVRTVEGLTQIVVPLLLGLEQLEDKQTLIHDVAATEFLYVTPESSKFVLFLIGESASREERIGMLIILEKLKFVEVISAVQHSLEEALSRLPIEEHKRWKIPLFLLLAFREIAGGKKDVALTCYYELIQQVDKSFFETEIQSFHVQKILLSILEKCTSQEEVVGWNFLVQQAAKGYEPWEPSLLFTHLVHCLCGEAKQTIHNLFFLARKSGYAVGSEEYSTILEESYFIGKQRRICEHLGEIFPLKEEVTPAIMPHALHSVFQIFSVVIPEHRPQIVMPLRALLLSSFSKNTTGMDLLVEILKSGVYTEAFRKSIIMGILKDLIEGGGYSRQMFIKFILHADNPLALSSTNPLRLLMNDLLEEDDSFIGRVRLLLKYGSSFQEKLSSLSCVFDTQKQIRKALVARIEVIMKELHDRNGSPCNGQLFSLVETFSILPEELWAEAQTAIFAYPSLVHRGIFGDLLTNIPAWIPRCRDHLLILLQSQTLPMRARVLAKFVIKWQDVLGVQEEHPLIQSCIEILYVTDPEGVFLEENPYRVYKLLQEKAPLQKAHTKPLPYVDLQDKKVRLCIEMMQQAQHKEYVVADLPPEISFHKVQEMFDAIRLRISAQGGHLIEAELQKIYKASLKELEKNILYGVVIPKLLTPPMDPKAVISETMLYLHIIMHYILQQESKCKEGELLSIRETALLNFASSVTECETGQKDGIALYYNALPLEERMGNRALEDTEVKRIKLVDISMQAVLHNTFADRDFLVELSEDQRIQQLSHQTLHMKNVMGNLVGLNHSITFDLHTRLLSKKLLFIDPSRALEVFGKYCTPKQLVTQWIQDVCTMKATLQAPLRNRLEYLLDLEKVRRLALARYLHALGASEQDRTLEEILTSAEAMFMMTSLREWCFALPENLRQKRVQELLLLWEEDLFLDHLLSSASMSSTLQQRFTVWCQDRKQKHEALTQHLVSLQTVHEDGKLVSPLVKALRSLMNMLDLTVERFLFSIQTRKLQSYLRERLETLSPEERRVSIGSYIDSLKRTKETILSYAAQEFLETLAVKQGNLSLERYLQSLQIIADPSPAEYWLANHLRQSSPIEQEKTLRDLLRSASSSPMDNSVQEYLDSDEGSTLSASSKDYLLQQYGCYEERMQDTLRGLLHSLLRDKELDYKDALTRSLRAKILSRWMFEGVDSHGHTNLHLTQEGALFLLIDVGYIEVMQQKIPSYTKKRFAAIQEDETSKATT